MTDLIAVDDRDQFQQHLPEGWLIMSWAGDAGRMDVVLHHQKTGAVVQLWLRQRVDPTWLLAFLELAVSANVRVYVEPKGASWL